jgi:5-methylthioribose kinase
LQLDDASLVPYVRSLGLLPPDRSLEVEPAGDGNINYVRRIRAAGDGSLIVKHARPTLERFPEYEAPTERLLFEYAYGEVVLELAPEEAPVLPQVLHFDPEARALVLEDLGNAPRLEEELLAGRVPEAALARVGRFLGRVHAATRPRAMDLEPRFENLGMRELHGEHIFTFPFEPNDFPIPSEVRHEARRLLEPSLRGRIRELRKLYYDSRQALVHADVQPSNILLVDGEPKLLDAEIAHVGDPAFDVGTVLAHLHFHLALRPDSAPLSRAERGLLEEYRAGGGKEEDVARAYGYAAVEMLRRTTGAARVRAVEDPAAALAALRHAASLLRS